MPLHLLTNKKAIHEVKDVVEGMAKEMHEAKEKRTDTWNPQTVYTERKKEISIQTEVNKSRHTSNMVKAKLEMETVSKYWMNIGNKKKLWDMIKELRELGSNPPILLKHSDKMANAAWDFYNELQSEETFPHTRPAQKTQAITQVLEEIRRKVP
ncbi:hypothetical protein IW261DRAFT_1427712 [Armillaria novae-zelandiae]|uniref:Uncharacterized protein n=1 Tax=Armillaria novae-zelandiae TaxID=153914 RepID=A0AA39ND11_9AGAR|nr:hypothetical protein IW261DRAFT_1427712 [Armillaria novae-zelandiae]